MRTLFLLVVIFGAGAATVGLQHRHIQSLDADIGMERNRLAGLRRAAGRMSVDIAEHARHAGLEQDRLDMLLAQRAVAEKYGPAPAPVWRARIEMLRREMAATFGPTPELQLLEWKDWIDAAARANGATRAEMQGILAALRSTARVRVALKLQEALRAYTEASGGILPPTIDDLSPYLVPPLSLQVLDGYRMVRAGAVAGRKDPVAELKREGVTIELALDDFKFNGPGMDLLSGLHAAAAEAGGNREGGHMDLLHSFKDVLPTIAERMPQFSDDQRQVFGDRLKQAIRLYRVGHGGVEPKSLYDLRDLLPEAVQLAERFRPYFAEIEYAIEHRGTLSTAPNQLKRYLDQVDVGRVMRRLALKSDGDSVEMKFDLKY